MSVFTLKQRHCQHNRNGFHSQMWRGESPWTNREKWLHAGRNYYLWTVGKGAEWPRQRSAPEITCAPPSLDRSGVQKRRPADSCRLSWPPNMQFLSCPPNMQFLLPVNCLNNILYCWCVRTTAGCGKRHVVSGTRQRRGRMKSFRQRCGEGITTPVWMR